MSLTVKKDKLSIPDGTEDVLGIDMRIREHVIKIIKETYEKFGFNPHKTPILEYQKTFDGHHGEGEKLFFKIVDKNNNKIMPRYDLTVPFARVANMHNEIPRPYKRYQIGYSFRDDEPGDSHYREFTQCDADIIGTKSLLAEVDITKMAHQLLNNLGIKNFILRVNHRLLIKSIAKKVGITTKYQQLGLQRALDYVDKISKSCQEEMYHKLTEHSIDTNTSEKIISTIKSLSTKNCLLQTNCPTN
ncbi:ATP phosphoribosyltransferase regulatory subunit [Terrilactibacillus sp. S3-3]|nr:ATP phosphoribosyltransferase regulatory subunit [Terrilactibacillus sp. S3-3]